MKGCAPEVIVALDLDDLTKIDELLNILYNTTKYVKIGSMPFTKWGRSFIEKIIGKGFEVFLDLKFHDIPSIVAAAGIEAMKMGVKIFNVHISGGMEMMKATSEKVKNEAARIGMESPLILGVTILTSLDLNGIEEVFGKLNRSLERQVVHMATLAKKAGLDGIVASPSEIIPVKEQIGKDFKVLTPGIRPLWSVHGDQKRICSPGEAAKRGADFLVIGRPIFGDRDPAYAFLRIMNEIKDAIK